MNHAGGEMVRLRGGTSKSRSLGIGAKVVSEGIKVAAGSAAHRVEAAVERDVLLVVVAVQRGAFGERVHPCVHHARPVRAVTGTGQRAGRDVRFVEGVAVFIVDDIRVGGVPRLVCVAPRKMGVELAKGDQDVPGGYIYNAKAAARQILQGKLGAVGIPSRTDIVVACGALKFASPSVSRVTVQPKAGST